MNQNVRRAWRNKALDEGDAIENSRLLHSRSQEDPPPYDGTSRHAAWTAGIATADVSYHLVSTGNAGQVLGSELVSMPSQVLLKVMFPFASVDSFHMLS